MHFSAGQLGWFAVVYVGDGNQKQKNLYRQILFFLLSNNLEHHNNVIVMSTSSVASMPHHY